VRQRSTEPDQLNIFWDEVEGERTQRTLLGWGRAERIRVKKGANLADRLGLLFKRAFARIHVDKRMSKLDYLEFNDLIRAILSALG
jgi:hypothetical protein